MSEHQPPSSEPGPVQTDSGQTDTGQTDSGQTDDAAEAELIRKVLRTQERHREGGIDPELEENAGQDADDAGAGDGAAGSDYDG